MARREKFPRLGIAKKPPKPCTKEGCPRMAQSGMRFCPNCLSMLRTEMYNNKYLRDIPGGGNRHIGDDV